MLKEIATQLAADVGIANPEDLAKVDRIKGWTTLAEAGLLALRVRDDQGQPGASGTEVKLVAEALGARLAPLPYASSAVLATELLALAQAPAAWLEELAEGTARAGLVMKADLSGLAFADDLADTIVWGAEEASYALALSGDPTAPSVVKVPLGSGFAPVDGADLTTALLASEGALDAPALEPAGTALSPEDYQRWLALALTIVSADMVGAMRQGLTDVVEYTKQRVQYGVLIGSFQAVQHLCAEMLVAVEGSDSTVKYAAWTIDELDPAEALLAARTAKAYTAHAARSVPETIMQVYGGIGQTWEHIAHFINRRCMLDRELFGDDDVQLLAIADARLGGN
jgi:alkylation response protein AidB-like acyl-CoA dehydrogenase